MFCVEIKSWLDLRRSDNRNIFMLNSCLGPRIFKESSLCEILNLRVTHNGWRDDHKNQFMLKVVKGNFSYFNLIIFIYKFFTYLLMCFLSALLSRTSRWLVRSNSCIETSNCSYMRNRESFTSRSAAVCFVKY